MVDSFSFKGPPIGKWGPGPPLTWPRDQEEIPADLIPPSFREKRRVERGHQR